MLRRRHAHLRPVACGRGSGTAACPVSASPHARGLRVGPFACAAQLARASPRAVCARRLAVLRRSPPSPKRQRSLAALRALLLAACALLLLVKTSATVARALARAFAPSPRLAASSVPRKAPRRLFTPPSAAMAPMKLLAVRTAKRTYPTGDPSFAVQQVFPAGALHHARRSTQAPPGGHRAALRPRRPPPPADTVPRSPALTRPRCPAPQA